MVGYGFDDVPGDVLKQDNQLNDELAALKKKRQEALREGKSGGYHGY